MNRYRDTQKILSLQAMSFGRTWYPSARHRNAALAVNKLLQSVTITYKI